MKLSLDLLDSQMPAGGFLAGMEWKMSSTLSGEVSESGELALSPECQWNCAGVDRRVV